MLVLVCGIHPAETAGNVQYLQTRAAPHRPSSCLDTLRARLLLRSRMSGVALSFYTGRADARRGGPRARVAMLDRVSRPCGEQAHCLACPCGACVRAPEELIMRLCPQHETRHSAQALRLATNDCEYPALVSPVGRGGARGARKRNSTR